MGDNFSYVSNGVVVLIAASSMDFWSITEKKMSLINAMPNIIYLPRPFFLNYQPRILWIESRPCFRFETSLDKKAAFGFSTQDMKW